MTYPPCPISGEPIESYRVVYGYAPCPCNCGNPVNTPCTDEAILSPCGHSIIGQENISAWERSR
jgi:hypothetical protein